MDANTSVVTVTPVDGDVVEAVLDGAVALMHRAAGALRVKLYDIAKLGGMTEVAAEVLTEVTFLEAAGGFPMVCDRDAVSVSELPPSTRDDYANYVAARNLARVWST